MAHDPAAETPMPAGTWQRARPLIVLVATVIAMALTARLGWWQLDRASQKVALQQQLEGREKLPPLEAADLARDPEQAQQQADRRVRLQGRWLNEHTVFLDNRPMAGRVGFFVLTPLLLDNGRAVLVQRGWVPRDAQDRTRLPQLPLVEERAEVLGRLNPRPSQLYQLGGAEQGRIRQNVELSSFAQETGLRLAPLVLLQLADGAQAVPANDGLLRQWPAPSVDVHKHYGYAFQWFALCALIAGLYAWFRFLKPLKQRRAQHGK